MSVLDPTKCLTVPGRLVIAPTNAGMKAGVYPWGSTAPIGLVAKAKFVREEKYAYYHSEQRGRDKVTAYRGRISAGFSCVLVQWDPTVNDLLWDYTTTSPNGYAGANVLRLPNVGGNLQPGLVAVGSPLLFGADDPTLPSLLIYAPYYLLEEKLALDTVLNKPLEEAFVVGVGLDGTGRDVAFDLVQNLAI